jgi:hypothetical protein
MGTFNIGPCECCGVDEDDCTLCDWDALDITLSASGLLVACSESGDGDWPISLINDSGNPLCASGSTVINLARLWRIGVSNISGNIIWRISLTNAIGSPIATWDAEPGNCESFSLDSSNLVFGNTCFEDVVIDIEIL